MKKTAYTAAAGSILCLKHAAGLLPWKTCVSLGGLLGRAVFLIPSSRKKTAMGNLEIAFGGRAENGRIACESFENMGKGFCEALASERFANGKLGELVSLTGKENLESALEKGRGVIAVSAHLGNFTFIGIKLAAEGYPFSYVFRYPRLELLGAVVRSLGERHGVGFIPALPRKEAARRVIKRLRKNEIVCMLGDQSARGGVEVNFFNRAAYAAAGPVVLAVRTGAPIVPMFSLRGEDDRHEVVIEPEFKLVSEGGHDIDVRENTRRLSGMIERYVGRHPSQWWWVHRRWKGFSGGGGI